MLRLLALALAAPAAGLGGRHGLSVATGPEAFRDPDVWGPPTWFFLHSMTLALPEHVPLEQQQRVKELMRSLQSLLPCPSCGKHLAEHMREHPIEPHLGTRAELVRWMVELHNLVNRDCGKRAWSVEEVTVEYAAAFAGRGAGAVLNRSAARAVAPMGLAALLALALATA
mmetsp:Transcript_69310/g.196405  ORF Transcript_69310/g.196405 Transcript_69310/m.196405 type:complete len:170 (+) Transcript_69310:87-596(+)